MMEVADHQRVVESNYSSYEYDMPNRNHRDMSSVLKRNYIILFLSLKWYLASQHTYADEWWCIDGDSFRRNENLSMNEEKNTYTLREEKEKSLLKKQRRKNERGECREGGFQRAIKASLNVL